jgi:hypothetical protein
VVGGAHGGTTLADVDLNGDGVVRISPLLEF